jgi:hypothetical protein
MTKDEQTIANLKKLKSVHNGRYGADIDRAIKAMEQEPILDQIRGEFIARYPKNYMGELEFGGRSCEFTLNQILHIIDKYRTESEGKE